jgi:outer membrane protein assembly factor BamD
MKHLKYLILILPVVMLFGCGSSKDKSFDTADELYTRAMELYLDEDYLEAKELFDVFKLQYPASNRADDAQFFLSEIHFHLKEYILAAFNYNRLRSIYPGSDYVEESMYMEAECYYQESPSYERDQDYTKKAIGAFQEFQYLYPQSDSLYSLASERLDDLRNKLARKDYSIAVLYTKLDDPRAAVVYFDSVISNYNDTEYYEPALYGKIEALVEMNKTNELKNVIRFYKNSFPDGNNLGNVKNIEANIY